MFFDCLAEEFTFWQTFLLLLWTFFIWCHKVSNFLQTLISGWLKTSFKQQDCEPPPPTLEMKNLVLPPQNPKVLLPSTPNHYTPKHPYSHERNFAYPSLFFLPLTNAFVIEHIFKNCQWMRQCLCGAFVK
jgi:hypothetical protein